MRLAPGDYNDVVKALKKVHFWIWFLFFFTIIWHLASWEKKCLCLYVLNWFSVGGLVLQWCQHSCCWNGSQVFGSFGSWSSKGLCISCQGSNRLTIREIEREETIHCQYHSRSSFQYDSTLFYSFWHYGRHWSGFTM
jgi:hypothetical protein